MPPGSAATLSLSPVTVKKLDDTSNIFNSFVIFFILLELLFFGGYCRGVGNTVFGAAFFYQMTVLMVSEIDGLLLMVYR